MGRMSGSAGFRPGHDASGRPGDAGGADTTGWVWLVVVTLSRLRRR